MKVIVPDDVQEASFEYKKMGLKNMRKTEHFLHFISAVKEKMCSVV